MKRLFVALMASAFLTTGVAMAHVNNNGTRSNLQHNTVATPKPTPTPRRTHGVNYNSSKSNTGNVTMHGHLATPTPKPTSHPMP